MAIDAQHAKPNAAPNNVAINAHRNKKICAPPVEKNAGENHANHAAKNRNKKEYAATIRKMKKKRNHL
jgi:hypothetical protein